MATDDLIGVTYDGGYVWNFKVTKGTEAATVGVKAVAIDKTLYVTEINTEAAGKLVTVSGVISYVAQEIAKLGKLELRVVTELGTPGENTLGAIYLVSKGEEKSGYREYITVKGGTEASPTYAWEEIGDTDVDLKNYVMNTDYATSAKGGVIKSSNEKGKISVGDDGDASLNGYDDLVKSDDLKDYYAYQTGELESTHHLISKTDQTKLDGIATGATKTTFASEDTDDGKKITITNQSSVQDSIDFTIPKPAYNTIIVKTEDDTVKAVATEENKSLTITAGDGIILEAKTATDGGPSLNISIDTTDVIDIATTIPKDKSKDDAIPNVGAVKVYVDSHKGSSPTYVNGLIDLTV